MAQNPKYDNDMVNLGYLNKRLGQTEESISKNNNSISQLPKNYSTPPNPPYYKDSLLCYFNKIYRCNTTKLKGEFSWHDWTIVATDDTTLSDFIKNTYELDKLEIQEQIDGKIQTHYQDNDPSKDWATDLEKGRHVGDYWYNTTNDTQWRYNQITTGPTITYGWAQVNIPKAVFDTLDTKKSIYTEKPTSYQKDDLWIIEETLSDDDLPIGTEENPIAKGDWVFSVADSETFNKSHWVKRDEDISMTYIQTHYYTIGEIDYSFEEIERNTDSKITKAKDEISLSVEQTYTTKEEHEATIYDFDEKIGTINQTVTEHKETIADLSIEVGEITSTVETIETTTKNLEINIDSVSADFEDFKDNEYIQSIDNLQKQIDGAIQFWNGAEIPTLENYPTNEWTTENDKINHQADIYTVVEDIDGEMKQGKSYRFDKIDGVWQWIELTDNELSAVQAIAQEALDKANANAGEIGAVKTRVSTLEQTDEHIKASVESIDNQITPTATVSGSNIYVEDASDNPLIQLEIEGKSTQETRSGKNIFNYEKYLYSSNQGLTSVLNEDGSITTTGIPTYSSQNILKTYDITDELEDGTTYTYSLGTYGNKIFMQLLTTNIEDGSKTYISNQKEPKTFTVDKSKYTYIIKIITTTLADWGTESLTITNTYQLEKGDTATEFEKYGAMPSPDFPSEIISVGYENLFDKNNIVPLALGSTSIETHSSYKGYYIPCNAGDVFSLSRNDTTNGRFRVSFTTEEPASGVAYFGSTGSVYDAALTIENIVAPENANYIFVYLSNQEDELPSEIQLNRGASARSYVPYGKYGIEVVHRGKNMFNYVDNLIASTNGVTSVLNEDGSITVSGLPLSNYTVFVRGKIITDDLEDGSTYTISTTTRNNNVRIQVQAISKEDGSFVYYTAGANNATFIVNKSLYNYKIYAQTGLLSNWGTESRTFTGFYQLEKGSVATEWRPYFRNSTVFELDQPLRSLPNGVKDIAYIKNNRLYVDRKVSSVVFDGNENWGNAYGENLFNTDALLAIGRTGTPISNYYIFNEVQYGINDTLKDGEFAIQDNTGNGLFIKNTDISTVDEFKTWLSQNNVKVDYELAEPYTEELGEIQMPSTFKGINHILTTDELEPTINVEYIRDTILSDYVEKQIGNVTTIQERKIAELIIEDDNIKASVSETQSTLDGTISNMDKLESKMTSQSATLEIISTNIDKTTGEVREVTTTNGLKFNAAGLNLYNGEDSYNTLIDNVGTYYKDGDTVISETTKDGFMATNSKNKGQHSYSYDDTNDIYEFIDERIEADGEYAYATFYNGEE